MDDKRWERTNRLLGAGLCGLAAATGSLVVLFAGAGPLKALPDREGAALMMAAFAAMILSGAPAGWAASGKGPGARTMAAGAGAYLAPMAAWFAGLEPAWPACLAWAWALSFAGSWIGLGLAALLGRCSTR
jgi:hypothetical protein